MTSLHRYNKTKGVAKLPFADSQTFKRRLGATYHTLISIHTHFEADLTNNCIGHLQNVNSLKNHHL